MPVCYPGHCALIHCHFNQDVCGGRNSLSLPFAFAQGGLIFSSVVFFVVMVSDDYLELHLVFVVVDIANKVCHICMQLVLSATCTCIWHAPAYIWHAPAYDMHLRIYDMHLRMTCTCVWHAPVYIWHGWCMCIILYTLVKHSQKMSYDFHTCL